MQKIQTKKSSTKRLLYIILIVVLLGLIGYTAYSYFDNPSLFDNKSDKESASDDQKAAEQKDSNTDNQSEDKNAKAPSKSEDVDVTKPVDDIPVAEETSITIAELYQKDGRVDYRANVRGTAGGTCSALFESERGKPVTRTSKSTGKTCSASIPAMEFDAPGDWTLTLRYYIDNTKATATKDITIR